MKLASIVEESNFQLSPIKAMELAASRIPGAISLAQGIPSFATPLAIRDYVKEKIDSGACDKYSLTTGLSEFREEVALALNQDGLNYDPETEIIATCGAAEGISAAIMGLTSPGDEVIIPSPTYASYLGSVGLAKCEPRFIALDEDNNFNFDIESLKNSLSKKTKVILLCSPNNPTGTLFSEANLREVTKLALERGIYLVIDEVYKDFYYVDHPHFTPASIPEARSHVVRVCSFSKAFAMTGWRVGFMHSAAATIQRILKYHDAMVTCAPVVSQYAAIAALRFGAESVRGFQAEFRRRRDYTIERLDKLSNVLDYQVPKATYFVFPRIKQSVLFSENSQRLAYDILEKAKLALVPGSAFGPAGESHLRISFGRDMHDLQEGFNRLEHYFSKSTTSTQRQIAADLNKSVNQNATLSRKLIESILALAAKIYLKRTRPKIIGITGTIGKTVFKRIIYDELRCDFRVRASILSYNTEIGLPLSILSLAAPKGTLQKLLFPVKLLCAAFLNPAEEILVLEYGVRRAGDAEQLLAIARPDWLLISSASESDPGLSYQSVQNEVRKLAQALPPSRVLYNSNDSVLAEMALELGLSPANALKGLEKPPESLIGESAKLGFEAAQTLIKLLKK